MAIPWYMSSKLIDSRTPISFQKWRTLFCNASSVHFAGAVRVSDQLELSTDPQYSAYALLAPRYCPVSYHSVRYF